MTDTTLPELLYRGVPMRAEPVNVSLADVVTALYEGRIAEVQLEPGDQTRYDLVLIPDTALPLLFQVHRDDPTCGIMAVRVVGGEPCKSLCLMPWERWKFGQLSEGNEWTAELLAWWLGILFDAIEGATEDAH